MTLPVLFHLFFRLKRQMREFPSLMFFTRIDPRLSARRKIHEWLILFLRCLFIWLVALALTRPITNIGPGGGTARIILIDNSGSMAAPTANGMTKLAFASRAAEKILTSAQSGDSTAFQLVVPDPLAALPKDFNADPATIRHALDKLTPTESAPQMLRAIRNALATLDTAKQPTRELHILTDLQKNNWSQGEIEAQVGQNCRVILHQIAAPNPSGGWVSLKLSDFPNRSLPAGRISVAQVTLQNHGATNALIRLNTTDDTGKNASRDISVKAGETISVPLTFSFENIGFHWAQIWIEGDIAEAASHAALGFWCTDSRKVAFQGNKDRFAALPFAVAPGGSAELSGIETSFVPPDQLPATLSTKPLAVAITWEEWPQNPAALESYVRDGGTLFVVPAPEIAGVSVTTAPPAWLEASLENLITPAAAETLLPLQNDDPIWRGLRDSSGKPKFSTLKTFVYRPLSLKNNWQPLLASEKGATLFARKNLGKGTIYASGISFAPKWSSLPLKGVFVVMIQNAIFIPHPEKTPVQILEAGEDFHFDQPKTPSSARSLAGNALTWEGLPQDFVGLTRSGIYEIRQKDQVQWAAIHAASEEASPELLDSKSIPLLKNLPHEVVLLSTEEDIQHAYGSRATGAALYGWLLAAALIVMLVETWFANERSSTFGRNLMDMLKKALVPKSSKKGAS